LVYAIAFTDFRIKPILSGTLKNGARADYAGNGGEIQTPLGSPYFNQPTTLPVPAAFNWGNPDSIWSGIFLAHRQIKITDIVDGTSKTYLAGEKYVMPDCYANGTDIGDDQGPYTADDRDTIRWASFGLNSGDYLAPMRDRSGFDNQGFRYGSAHSSSFNVALCDGSVHSIGYDISEAVHRQLCNRKDKTVIGNMPF
jgi:prepilin-type processing-associated H-X9-DG protein